MPASSRKRNKGKERKAKKEADKAEAIRLDSHEFWRSFCGSNQCDHGRAVIFISDDHPVSIFIDQLVVNLDQFYKKLCHKGKAISNTLKELLITHPQIWNSECYRRLAIGILAHIGTNMLMQEDIDMSWPVCFSTSILVLEHYNGTDDFDLVLNKQEVVSKWRDMSINSNSSVRRDVLKFYRKRTTCKCLKKMHLEARKSTAKMGKCHHCAKEMDRVHLSVCSRCMLERYCSRECQVADWPDHQRRCL